MDFELQKVLEIAIPLAESLGLEVLKGEFVQDHGRKILRIFLDKTDENEGIKIQDCEKFSQTLSPILDVEGEVRGSYDLEVSSPGLNRPLRLPRHFSSQLGKIVQVTTEEPVDERRKFKGELIKVEEEGAGGKIEILVDHQVFQIPFDLIKKANLDFFASEEQKAETGKPGNYKK
jgi:ribosome maturation factor RimP